MPEFYPSIGEAIGAAMQHNIRIAHGGEASGSDTPLQVRYLPHPSADPYSVTGMIARLTETATPHEVAGIIEEVNSTLVGALPQLTELVAAAADWTRARLAFEDPHHNPTFDTCTRLAAATRLLRDVQEEMEAAEDMVAACPPELSDPKYRDERRGACPADPGTAQRCPRRRRGRRHQTVRGPERGSGPAASRPRLLPAHHHPAGHALRRRDVRTTGHHAAAPVAAHPMTSITDPSPEQELPR
ncbi:hypothetical protein [Streptomyces avermitilis]|uniref:hypothetical protein n=1 Tax=Streptomyces avermitilis TaxID=33903 RepID=UPI0037196BF3